MTTARPLPAHGTEGRYKGTALRPGCKCTVCVHGWSKAHQLRALARLEGRPATIPAGPVTAHIQNLTANHGLSHCQIANAAKVNTNTVVEHGRGRFPTIRRTVAERILAVTPARAATTGLVNATGTRRRLQALYAIGHGVYRIAAAHEHLNDKALDYILRGQRASVTIATRDAVMAVYATLASQPGPSVRARRRAEAEGWPGPDYWEDVDRIDDPDFDPNATISRARQVAEDARWLLDGGLNRDHIAQRLGVSRFYIDKALREHPDAGQAAA